MQKKYTPTFHQIMNEMNSDAKKREKRLKDLGDIDEYLKDI